MLSAGLQQAPVVADLSSESHPFLQPCRARSTQRASMQPDQGEIHGLADSCSAPVILDIKISRITFRRYDPSAFDFCVVTYVQIYLVT